MKLHHRIQISRNKTEISASCVYKFGWEDFEEVRILTLFDLNDRRLTSMRLSLPAFRALQRYDIIIIRSFSLRKRDVKLNFIMFADVLFLYH